MINSSPTLNDAIEQVINYYTHHKNLPHLIELATKLSGNNMIIRGVDSRIFANSVALNDSLKLVTKSNRLMSPDFQSLICKIDLYTDAKPIGQAYYYDPILELPDELSQLMQGNKLLFVPIKSADIEIARLIIEVSEYPNSYLIQFFEQLSLILELPLEHSNQTKPQYTQFLPSYPFEKLFLESNPIIEINQQQFPWINSHSLQIMLIRQMNGNHIKDILPYIINSLVTIIPKERALLVGDELVIFYIASMDHKLSNSNNFRGFLTENGLVAGLSQSFSNISQAPHFLYQAQQLMKLSSHVQDRIISYTNQKADLFSQMLLEQFSETDIIDSRIQRLQQFDQQNNTELFETLKIAVEHLNNRTEAASLLHIHRNTLNYRLNQITNLTGLSLTNAKDISAIVTSIQIIEFISN